MKRFGCSKSLIVFDTSVQAFDNRLNMYFVTDACYMAVGNFWCPGIARGGKKCRSFPGPIDVSYREPTMHHTITLDNTFRK